jgi:hypothetical protein
VSAHTVETSEELAEKIASTLLANGWRIVTAEQSRRAECFDDLLAALQGVSRALTIENSLNPTYGWGDFVEKVVTPAIRKATGEQP